MSARLGFWALLCGACASGGAHGAGSDGAPLAEDAAAQFDAGVHDAGPRALVHAALWTQAAALDDPFGDGSGAPCALDSYGEEYSGGELSFFVRTASCPKFTARQAIRSAVAEGELVRVRFFHFPLSAPEAGVARVELRLADHEMWRAEFPIPSDQAELSAEWTAPDDYAQGTPLWLHVENHGANEYLLIAVEVID